MTPELPDGVGEAQHPARDQAGPGERHRDGPEGVPGRRPQRGRCLQRTIADRFEGAPDGLDGERQRVDDGTDDQPRKRERQGTLAEQPGHETTRPVGPQRDQQVETNDGGGQNEGESDEGGDRLLEPEGGAREPPRDRGSEQQEEDRGHPGQLEREPNRRPDGFRAHDRLGLTPRDSRVGGESRGKSPTRGNRGIARQPDCPRPASSSTACCRIGAWRSSGTSQRDPPALKATCERARNPTSALPVRTNWCA